jgi:hypothetical protein
MAKVMLSEAVSADIKNKVTVYAKIVSGQSNMFKEVPNYNLVTIAEQYTSLVTEQVIKEHRLRKQLARKYAKQLVEEAIEYYLSEINR